MKVLILSIITLWTLSCNSQSGKVATQPDSHLIDQESTGQIGKYVLSVYEDSKGHLWFATLEQGIARYDGTELRYFTQADGLPSNRVTNVIEDAAGIYWFSTGEGLSKYDGEEFTNYVVKKEDWGSNAINELFIDQQGQFWIGTWAGVYKFDGSRFTPFAIPFPEVETAVNNDTKNWVTEIDQDADGNMWFAIDGFGAFKYEGDRFVHYLKSDGLLANTVTEIEFDKDGNTWFGTRVAERDNADPEKRVGKAGVNIMIDNEISSIPDIAGFSDGDVYSIYHAGENEMWISTVGNGVYMYNGVEFTNHPVPISCTGILKDRHGIVWLAGAGGLYKINKDMEVVNVSRRGPWN